MSSNLVHARSSIAWILTVLVAFAAVWWIERASSRTLIDRSACPVATGTPTAGPRPPAAAASGAAPLDTKGR